MFKRVILFFIVLFLIINANAQKKDDFPLLKGPYLGQEPPGMTPEIFAPGFISTEKKELNSVFTPDGKEFYFSINTPGKGYTIWFSKMVQGKWTKPQEAPFNSSYSDVDMCISTDGRRMFFGSNRPLKPGGPKAKDFFIWMVERIGDSWSKPKNPGTPINSGKRALYPTITRNGTLYFQAIFPGGYGGRDIYRSRFVNGKYQEPENLGEAINTEHGEGDVLIAPDESFLIVNASNRPDSYGKSDLYISFRHADGTWTKAKNMGPKINSKGTDYCPMLSPDGRYFFFTSTKTGNGDIYWVDAKIIEKLKPKE